MKRRSQLDRAIDSLEGEVAVLQAAIVKLKQQREKAPVRKSITRSITIGPGSISALNTPEPRLT